MTLESIRKGGAVLVTVAGLKGGVGKTTLAVGLAEAGAARWGSALLVDADEQGSALRWADLAGDRLRAVTVALPTLDLGRRLAGLDAARYPLVVIDTGPGRPDILSAALALSDVAALPCRPSIADTDRLWRTAELAEAAGVPALAVLSFTRARTVARAAAREALRAGRVKVARAELPQREAVARGFGEPVTGALADVAGALLSELTRTARKVTR
jgi:chromosome partitioning protein